MQEKYSENKRDFFISKDVRKLAIILIINKLNYKLLSKTEK